MSYEIDVAAIYDLYFPVDRSPEADFWAGLAGGGRDLLEPMVGSAEVAQLLARRGFRVTGVDLAPAMIAVARERLMSEEPAVAERLTLLEGDIAAVPLPGSAFDLAYVGNGSWNLLTDRELRVAALASIRRALRPGGRLALKLFKPFATSGQSAPRTFAPLRQPPNGLFVEKSSYTVRDSARQWFEIHETIHVGDQVVPHTLYLQVLTPERVGEELKRAGFGTVAFYGDDHLSPYTADSGDLIAIATA